MTMNLLRNAMEVFHASLNSMMSAATMSPSSYQTMSVNLATFLDRKILNTDLVDNVDLEQDMVQMNNVGCR